ncbi:hypothetical protein HYV88_01395 [Candidatus Woesearchaeota archaeon]|nr:hypothetical protein [Candidatus Woesearchaeota archaeon]
MKTLEYESRIEDKVKQVYVIVTTLREEEYRRLQQDRKQLEEILFNLNKRLNDNNLEAITTKDYQVHFISYETLRKLPKIGYDSPDLIPPLPEIIKVPDGSLGYGMDRYGSGWVVKGMFIPSLNRIYLLESSGEDVLNHELAHWYRYWTGASQGLTRAQEEAGAERDKIKARNKFEEVIARAELN